MSAHRKNWFQRLFGGDVGPSSFSNDATGPHPEASYDGKQAADRGESVASDSDADLPEQDSSAEELPAQGRATQEDPARERDARASRPNLERRTIFDPRHLDDVEFYRNMRVRLQTTEQAQVTDTEDAFGPESVVRPFSDDAVIRLVLDLPSAQSVTRSRKHSSGGGHTNFPLSTEHLDDRGPVEDLYRMGYRNLWQDLIDSDLHVTEMNPGPKELVWVFEGSSPYIGSAPIFLEELVQKYIPSLDMSRGLLFTMPSSGQMLVRDVTTGKELFHTIGLLATASADEYFKSADKLSPRLHLWHEGQIETISDIKLPEPGEKQTEIQIKPTAYLISQMNEGTDGPEDWMKGFGGEDPDGPDEAL